MSSIIKRMKSKTYWYGAAVMALGFAEQYGGIVTQLVPPQYQGLAVAVIGAGVWVLREVTSKPLDQK